MRRLASALLTLLFSTLAQAATVTTDYTDIWWNPDESGWGANVVQQGDTLFVTLFVFDGQHEATWLVAPNVAFQGGSKFSGPLYSVQGPWFAFKFDASTVVTSAVGTLTFEATGTSSAKLDYNSGGIVVTKTLTRLTLRSDTIPGLYLGAREGTWSGCGAALNGRVDSYTLIGITQQGIDVQIRDAGNRYTCNYTGKIQQIGKFSAIEGTGVCDDGVGRFLKATEIQVSPIALSMRYRMETPGSDCVFDGYLGGMRQLP